MLVTLKLAAGDVAIDATERDDIDVDVQPRDPRNRFDVEHAERTTVEHRADGVHVEAPSSGWRLGRSPAILVRVATPEGTDVDVNTASASVHTTGRLGSASITTASGSVDVASADALRARSASGSVHAGSIAGETELSTASGSGRIDDAGGSVSAKTASGSLRVGAARRGVVRLDAASGSLHIGVPHGTAAFLDVRSVSGSVRTELADADGPAEGEETVEIRARTVSGSVQVVRAS